MGLRLLVVTKLYSKSDKGILESAKNEEESAGIVSLGRSCDGDSGGPLTYTDENGTTTLYGVVFGPGDKPNCMSTGIMSRVSNKKALEWIKEKIAQYA